MSALTGIDGMLSILFPGLLVLATTPKLSVYNGIHGQRYNLIHILGSPFLPIAPSFV